MRIIRWLLRVLKRLRGYLTWFGQFSADIMTTVIGTWTFLLVQSAVIAWWVNHQGIPSLGIHDNQGLTIINLIMSIQAAEAFVVVLMSQNRQAARDRERIEAIYRVEEKIDTVVEHLEDQLCRGIAELAADAIRPEVGG